MTSTASNHDLFPPPCAPPSTLIPRVWPGANPETTTALQEVLRDNHTRWHIFFNDRGFHNHISHRALAIWALGAPGDAIKAGYKLDSSYQRPAFESPGAITPENFKDHISDKKYYSAYLAFFTEKIREQGIASTVEKFVFSKEYNHAHEGRQPDMLGRFLGGVLHPMIHIGYGFEFCLPGMVAEGLAQAAVHSDDSSARIPESFFDGHKSTYGLGDAVSRVHVFTILARVLEDPELSEVQDVEDKGMYTTTTTDHGAALAKHMRDWHVDATNPRDVERRIEELSWMNSLIYAIGGSQPGKPFNADFFHLHLVTSSLFLPSYLSLAPSTQALLLKSYLFTALSWWVSRGRPGFDVQSFYNTTSAHPMPPGRRPTPHKDALLSRESKGVIPNPWLPIVENGIVHPDDHISKIQRAFVHYGELYGSREAGLPDFKNTGLEGVEKLDGTLFVRAAALTDKRLGRVREGEEPGEWDRDGFYKSKQA